VTDFADLADGGRRLAPLLAAAVEGPVVLLAALPNGVPVALAMAEALPGAEVRALAVRRSDEGVEVEPPDLVAGLVVVVVDDGVETGTVARAAAAAVRSCGPERMLLAVPVCPREATADLQHRYDAIVAAVRPMARRDLAWHYRSFDTIDEATALRLLAAAGA
jgi:predicted phosphoribosyltransferase